MVTDEDRREVAARLRRLADNHDGVAGLIVERRLGLESDERFLAGSVFTSESVRRLADLIEPSEPKVECVPGECPLNVRHDNDRIDRERLLAIATMMAADSVRSVKQGSDVSPVYILHAARNIAEACGETFGSIRNQEECSDICRAYAVDEGDVVSVQNCDRDALLVLADEIDRKSNDGTVNPDPMNPIASSLDLFGYARRIREAVGA